MLALVLALWVERMQESEKSYIQRLREHVVRPNSSKIV
jgi:hypothetical protein